jgi:Tol biopolymer transport system component
LGVLLFPVLFVGSAEASMHCGVVDGVGGPECVEYRQPNGPSFEPAVSGDGRYVAIRSAASNLVDGDTNGVDDIFVSDLAAFSTSRVSLTSAGGQVGGASYEPAISADGRYVAFRSAASGIVAGDSNGVADVFVRDRTAGTTERVSVDGAGGQANGASYVPSVSADGRYVAFQSAASNLVGGDTNGADDVFVRDRTAGTTIRVSVGAGGVQANGASGSPAMSANGGFVAFDSSASNLVGSDTNSRLSRSS